MGIQQAAQAGVVATAQYFISIPRGDNHRMAAVVVVDGYDDPSASRLEFRDKLVDQFRIDGGLITQGDQGSPTFRGQLGKSASNGAEHFRVGVGIQDQGDGASLQRRGYPPGIRANDNRNSVHRAL